MQKLKRLKNIVKKFPLDVIVANDLYIHKYHHYIIIILSSIKSTYTLNK
jgi:hypothetical protein